MNFVGHEYQRVKEPVVEEQRLSDDDDDGSGSGNGSESDD